MKELYVGDKVKVVKILDEDENFYKFIGKTGEIIEFTTDEDFNIVVQFSDPPGDRLEFSEQEIKPIKRQTHLK